ncbi:MAG: hypothetical protein AAF517_14890, partial [Planctomycetota bacterium]
MRKTFTICVTLSTFLRLATSALAEDAPKPLFTLEHEVPVYRAEFSSDRTMIATCAKDGYARIWDAKTGKLLRQLETKPPINGRHTKLLTVDFSRDGNRLAAISEGEKTWVWNPRDGALIRRIGGRKWRHSYARFRSDGRELLTVDYGRAIVWDATTGKLVRLVQGSADGEEDDDWIEANWVESACHSPDNLWIATITERGSVAFWNAKTFEKVRGFEHRFAERVVFSPDGKSLLTLHPSNRHARIWSIEGKVTAKLTLEKPSGSRAKLVEFSPDGKLLAIQRREKNITVWDPATGRERYRLGGHTDQIHSVAFHPRSTHLLTGS